MALIEKKTIVKTEIDYDKLAKAIAKANNTAIDYDKLAKAIITANKAEKEADNMGNNEAIERFRKKYKLEFDEKGELKKGLKNQFRCFRAYLEYGKEDVGQPFLLFEVFKAIPILIIFMMECFCCLFGLIIIFTSVKDGNIFNRVGYCSIGVAAIMFGSVLRILKIEITAVSKTEVVNMIFSSMMALLCALFAFLALV